MRPLRYFAPLKRLIRQNEGSIPIEFAFTLPVLIIVLLGTFEVSKYVHTTNQVVQTVGMVGQMASQLPASAPVREVQRIWSAAPLVAPEAIRVARREGAASWSDALDVTITHIVFVKVDKSCESDCRYEAQVAWSVGQHPVDCGKLTASTSVDPSLANVPQELYAEGSVLSVRAALPYEPYFLATAHFIGGSVRALTTTLSEASWFLPRNAPQVVLTAGADTTVPYRLCPERNK